MVSDWKLRVSVLL